MATKRSPRSVAFQVSICNQLRNLAIVKILQAECQGLAIENAADVVVAVAQSIGKSCSVSCHLVFVLSIPSCTLGSISTLTCQVEQRLLRLRATSISSRHWLRA